MKEMKTVVHVTIFHCTLLFMKGLLFLGMSSRRNHLFVPYSKRVHPAFVFKYRPQKSSRLIVSSQKHRGFVVLQCHVS